MFCDIHNLDGSPFGGDPRQVLRRNLEKAHELGFQFFVAPDMEFFYFAPPEKGQPPVPLDEGGFFDLTTTDVAGSLRKQTIRTLETMSIPVEYSFHEDAPSQHEIDLRHTDALTMADSIMTFRLVVKEVAASQGVHATFMPKPLEGVQGSGMHMHLSLFSGEDNAFYDDDDPYNLSPVAKQFMAGLLRHAAEITAITNQTVNSYKRLVPGFEAPVHVSWARNNRSGLIRVPIPKRGNAGATRIEYRSPDPACNPYLAFSVLLAAGLKGIEEGYELPAEADANLFEMTDGELSKLGIEQLPQSLSDALRVMETSELVADALGEHIFEWFLRNKRSEWRAYKTHVTPVRARPLPAVAVSGPPMDLFAVFPDPPPPDLARTLDLSGLQVEGASASADDVTRNEPATGWAGAVIAADADPEAAWAVARSLRKRDPVVSPLLVLVSGGQLADLELRDDLFDDFCLTPFHPVELEARLRHLFWRRGGGDPHASWSSTAGWSSTSRPIRRRSTTSRSTSRTWSTSCSSSSPRTRARCSPARCCSRGCGATSTTAGRARSTSTSAVCGPSSARSTPT